MSTRSTPRRGVARLPQRGIEAQQPVSRTLQQHGGAIEACPLATEPRREAITVAVPAEPVIPQWHLGTAIGEVVSVTAGLVAEWVAASAAAWEDLAATGAATVARLHPRRAALAAPLSGRPVL